MPLVRAGVVIGAFGVQGEIKLAYTTDNRGQLAARKRYILFDPRTGEALALDVERVKLRDDSFLLKTAQFSAPEELAGYSAWELCFTARRGELSRDDPDEVYFFELQGLEARRPDGSRIGSVSDVLDNGAHLILELDCPGRPMVPFLRQWIPEVNLAEGWLTCTYPLGEGERADTDSTEEDNPDTSSRRPRYRRKGSG